jgi:hypothetical protein
MRDLVSVVADLAHCRYDSSWRHGVASEMIDVRLTRSNPMRVGAPSAWRVIER